MKISRLAGAVAGRWGTTGCMRVVTFNILHGRSTVDDRVDPDRLGEAVRGLDADVLALQEVDRGQPRSHGVDQTALAAAAMGAVAHRFAPALHGTPGTDFVAVGGEDRPGATSYGIALLSRYPVASWRTVALPARAPEEPRVALVAAVDAPGGRLTVACTHLSFVPFTAHRQLRELARALADEARPLLLMGDLNMGRARAVRASGLRSLAEAATFPADAPRRQLDHVLADGPFVARSCEARRMALSDHRPLVVELTGDWDPRTGP